MIEAIILAGTSDREKRLIQGKNKFFVKIKDRYIGNTVIEALSETSVIDAIYVIGNKSELKKAVLDAKVRRIIQERGGYYANALEAFTHTQNSDSVEKQVLYSACDIPFLTARAVEDFISRAPDADFILPYCLREDFEALFPGYRWPYLVFKEGEVKFGNIALVKPNRIANRMLFDQFFGLRKVAVSDRRKEEMLNVPRVLMKALTLKGLEGLEIVTREVYLKYIAKPLGLGIATARYLPLGRIADVFSAILGCEVKGVRTRYPEICYDIDNERKDLKYAVENYEVIRKRIDSRQFII